MQVEGNVLRWQKWEMRVRFDPREGMILHNITFDHGGSAPRPILHRASMPEMTVPYAETQAPFHRRMAFGEPWPIALCTFVSFRCKMTLEFALSSSHGQCMHHMRLDRMLDWPALNF